MPDEPSETQIHAFTEPVSILMPVYNEVDVIESVVEEWVEDVLLKLPPGSEMIIDDAASTDGTVEILADLVGRYPAVQVNNNSQRDGYRAALKRLYLQATCPWTIFTDGDGQYVPQDFWRFVPYTREFKFIYGFKADRQDPFYRCFASNLFNAFTRWTFGLPYRDMNSPLRLIHSDIVRELVPELDKLEMLPSAELVIRAAAQSIPIKQLPIRHRARRGGGGSRSFSATGFFIEGAKAYPQLLALKRELSEIDR